MVGKVVRGRGAFPAHPTCRASCRSARSLHLRLQRRRSPATCPCSARCSPCSVGELAPGGRNAAGWPRDPRANGGIVIRPTTLTGRELQVARQLVRGDPRLALLAGDVDLEQDLGRPASAWRSSWRSADSRRHRVDQLHVRHDLLDLARLQLADEVPAEVRVALAFASRSCARFSPSSVRPASRQHADLLERHVLDRGEDLDLGRVAPGVGDRLAHALEVRADAGGVEAGDQARHTTPAWRPVTPWSRRWEKKRSLADRAQPDVVDLDAVRLELLRGRRRRCRGCCAAPRVVGRRSGRGPPRRPRSSSRGRSGPSAAVIGPVAADLAQRRDALVDDPAARAARQPQCSAATAPSAASRTGRQSATKTIAAASSARSPGRPPACTGASRDGGSVARRTGRAVHLAAVAEARPRDGRRARPAGAGSRRRSPGASSVSSPRLSESYGAAGDAAVAAREERPRVRQVGDELVVLPAELHGSRG